MAHPRVARRGAGPGADFPDEPNDDLSRDEFIEWAWEVVDEVDQLVLMASDLAGPMGPVPIVLRRWQTEHAREFPPDRRFVQRP